MSETPFTDAAGTAPRTELPITFLGFQELHAQAYFDYALTVLRDQALVQLVVDETFLALSDHWDRVLEHPNPAAHAWAALRRAVEAERARDAEHRILIERVAFSIALHRDHDSLLDGFRDHAIEVESSVADLEAGITLGAAISELSGAKFDVVVLRYLNKLTIAQTARAMGVDEGTVRSLTSQAKAKLRARLAPRRLLRPEPAQHDDQE
ncbi:RNA polymerase sigma factor [Kitasatospora sp. NPDC086009]|uniref:RNA polymerase sigma factor n=1 Tax=unclassified Kitasatospora TaxID=2633591 RepID=UPI0037C97906